MQMEMSTRGFSFFSTCLLFGSQTFFQMFAQIVSAFQWRCSFTVSLFLRRLKILSNKSLVGRFLFNRKIAVPFFATDSFIILILLQGLWSRSGLWMDIVARGQVFEQGN